MKSRPAHIVLIIGLILLVSSCSEKDDSLNSEYSEDMDYLITQTDEVDTTDNNEILETDNTYDIENVKKLFTDAINYENWFSGEWSTVWELNNAGKIKVNFYYDSYGSIYALTDKKISIENKEVYVLLELHKDKWGYGSPPRNNYYLELNDLKDEIRSSALEKIGTDYIDIKETMMPEMPDFSDLTQAKIEEVEKIVEHVEEILKEENKKGEFTIYFSNFIKEEPIINVIIQDEKGEIWYGAYSFNTDGSISSVLPNDYMQIETEDLKYYANQIIKIDLSKEIWLE